MKTFNKISIVLIVFSLICLYSCGKKDTTTSDSKSTDSKTSTDTKKESSGNTDLGSISDFTIKYDLTGKVKGEMTTYKKGKRIQQNLVMDIQGAKMSTKNYFDDKYAYMVMDVMGKKMGTKIDIGKYREEGAKEGKDIDYGNMEAYLKDKKKIGTETILGKECDVYETGKDVTISVWKGGLPLKISTPAMTMTAVSYDTKADVSESEMDPPKDVEYTDMSGMINKTKK
ncbi:MAG: hypothetical protein J0M18_07840 [Ignavibacteria bacterium]|jgi:hypothetical protein|nr:hypothetical protein [Ignavibacteria bacterium]